jgi:4-oxalocrotonate tautomerase
MSRSSVGTSVSLPDLLLEQTQVMELIRAIRTQRRETPMPHVTIKHFPRSFTAQEKRSLANALTEVVTKHFDTYEGAVSIALEPVDQNDWNASVYEPEITERSHLLIKVPEYNQK